MEIELAGINVPFELIKKIKQSRELSKEEKQALTPETISAAYARISRSKKNVDELVEESIKDTPKARRSVTNILGMGHHSIADHAIFNFNIKKVSRLVVEAIEERRLAGYTEKSQRYVTLDGDFVEPKEFSREDLKKFKGLVDLQNNFYFKVNEKLFGYLKKKYPLQDPKKLEGSAKEDARYALSLATETQLGCSYTGQTLELAIRKNKYSELEEQKEFSKMLFKSIINVAPSLIQLTDSELFENLNPGKKLNDDNFKCTKTNLHKLVQETIKKYDEDEKYIIDSKKYVSDVMLHKPKDYDVEIIGALLYTNSKIPFVYCSNLASLLIEKGEGKKFLEEALKHVTKHDKLPREFEISGLVYEIILSSSCFAQLKRHRLNTLLAQSYNPELGYTIPPNIKEIDEDKSLKEVCDKSSELFYEFLPRYGKAAVYCLTNAHRRRVIFACNMRQLYHISRIREDIHAQWEIRKIANKMSALAKEIAPETTFLLGGKQEFPD